MATDGKIEYEIDVDIEPVLKANKVVDKFNKDASKGFKYLESATKRASDSFNIISKEVNAARAKLDELKKSSDGSEKSLEDISKASLKLEKLLIRQSAASDKYTSALDKLNQKSNKGTKAFKLQKGAATQLGFQLQDVAVQAQQGTSAFTILGQQGSQLASVLGPGGALLGGAIAVGAAIGGVLYTALTGASEATEDFKVDIDELLESMDSLSDMSRSQIAVAIIDVNKRMDELSSQAVSTAENIAKMSKVLDQGFKETAGQRTIKLTEKATAELEDELLREQATLDKINQELKLNSNLLVELTDGTKGYADGTKDLTDKTDSLSSSLKAQIIALNEGEEAAFRYATAQQLGLKAGEMMPEVVDQQITEIFRLKEAQDQAKQSQDELTKSQREWQRMVDEQAALDERRQSIFDRLTGQDAVSSLEFLDQFNMKLLDTLRTANNVEGALGAAFGDVVSNSIDNLSSGLADAIVEGESFNEVLRNTGQAILKEVIGSLIKVGLQMAVNSAIGSSLSTTATTLAVAQAGTLASAWATPAALASLASFGSNSVPATAGIASTVAFANAASVGGGRRTGGNISAGMMHEVGEDGFEMLRMGNKNYLMPGRNGEVVSNDDLTKGAGGSNITIINNTPANVQATTENRNGIENTTITIDDVAADIRGRGKVFNAITASTTAQNRAGR